MLFKRRNRDAEVTEGAVFKRIHPTNLVELAEVVWVGKDSSGIPHVRYKMSYVRSDGNDPQGTRILSVSCFTERYEASPADAAA